jgi:hypothetical protein
MKINAGPSGFEPPPAVILTTTAAFVAVAKTERSLSEIIAILLILIIDLLPMIVSNKPHLT